MTDPERGDHEEAQDERIERRPDRGQRPEERGIGLARREVWQPDLDGQQRDRDGEDRVREEDDPFEGEREEAVVVVGGVDRWHLGHRRDVADPRPTGQPADQRRRLRRSPTISRAAFWPFWPVIPPPGWAPAPARYSPSSASR